ncbi:unnamed protein product [Bemisia tabaci]|uniref:Integrase catalytic domain-containing protein n=1 Tax=Bemisia tabaci TaxID=7038 RepID=A0A9P0A027_BEMTA|nr:PREDICTED: uncharacterized protein LOC109039696 [Bemisia tabaci]CAH0381428.1 unnamed protein product [Bemisia tabaci]
MGMAAANGGIDNETAETITFLRSTGMKWYRIAQHLNVDRRELFRLRLNMSAQQTLSVPLSDEELWTEIQHIKTEYPHFGELYVAAALLQRGFKIARQRIRECIREMDPEGVALRSLHFIPKIPRGIYWVPGAMWIWHADGNEKPKMFGVYIHGCVDGHSRYPIYLYAANNKRATTPFKVFYEAALKYGLPRFLRIDEGTENVKFAEFMEVNGQALDRQQSVFTGPSTKNVRIERFWGEVNDVTKPFKDLFKSIENEGILDTGDPVELFALHYIYLPRIQKSLDDFVSIWNVHSMRSAHCKTPSAMFFTEKYGTPETVLCHPVPEPEDLEEETLNMERHEFARTVIPDPLEDDGNSGINLYLELVNAIRDSLIAQ